MPASNTNPFAIPREARSVTITMRMTPTEHAAIKSIADRDRTDIVDVIREALAMFLDRRQSSGSTSSGSSKAAGSTSTRTTRTTSKAKKSK